MKKGKLLIALVAVLVVCTGALVAVNYSNTTKAEEDLTSTTSTVDTLLSFEKENIKELKVKDTKGELTFVFSEDNWSIKDAPSVELNTSAINSTCNNLLHISNFRTINSPDLKEFGIEDSSQVIEYILNDGQTISLTLGLKTPDGSQYYAIKDNNPSEVYLISSSDGNEVNTSLDRYRVKSLDTFDISTLVSFEASGRDLAPISVGANESGSELFTFSVTSPGGSILDIDSQALENLMTSLPSFSADSFVEDGVTDLSPYGLDNPVLNFKLTGINPADPEKTVTLEYLWGNDVEEDSIYFMKAGTSSVYTMKKAPIHSMIEQLTAFNLSNKLVSITFIDSIDSLEVNYNDKNYVLSIAREEVTLPQEDTSSDDKTESTEPTTEIVATYYLNNKPINESDFKTLYQNIIGTKADTDLTNKSPSFDTEPVATFTFNFSDGTSKQHTFYPYDNQFYTYKVDNELFVGCNIKQFNFIEQTLDTAFESLK